MTTVIMRVIFLHAYIIMFTGAVALLPVDTEYILPYLMTNVQCNGTEWLLTDCQHSGSGSYCSYYTDAALFCPGATKIHYD